MLPEQEQITYLANVIYLARLDGILTAREHSAVEEIRANIGAKKRILNAAMKAAESEGYSLARGGNFAAQVSNLFDMLYVCLLDGELEGREDTAIKDFSAHMRITSEQLEVMVGEAISRVEGSALSISCPTCSNTVVGTVRFCPSCGTPFGKIDEGTVKVAVEIPATGYVIEFSESSAGGFQAALEFAKSAPVFSTYLRGKRTWYLASWSEDSFMQVARLAELLSGIRNRRCYHKGSEVSWDELFGFVWCARNRNAAYRPVEYCFGKDENRLNPWGLSKRALSGRNGHSGFPMDSSSVRGC